MDKGTANMDLINKNMKKEMVDFVSFYRRFNNIAGKQSFSTLYTSINGETERGHLCLPCSTHLFRADGVNLP